MNNPLYDRALETDLGSFEIVKAPQEEPKNVSLTNNPFYDTPVSRQSSVASSEASLDELNEKLKELQLEQDLLPGVIKEQIQKQRPTLPEPKPLFNPDFRKLKENTKNPNIDATLSYDDLTANNNKVSKKIFKK